MPKVDGKNRPTAWGHRFGPDLSCSECGLSWDEHQGDPGPCITGALKSKAATVLDSELPALTGPVAVSVAETIPPDEPPED